MLTFLVWDLWLDHLGDALYDFMNALYRVSPDAYHAMNVGFDYSERYQLACEDLAYLEW